MPFWAGSLKALAWSPVGLGHGQGGAGVVVEEVLADWLAEAALLVLHRDQVLEAVLDRVLERAAVVRVAGAEEAEQREPGQPDVVQGVARPAHALSLQLGGEAVRVPHAVARWWFLSHTKGASTASSVVRLLPPGTAAAALAEAVAARPPPPACGWRRPRCRGSCGPTAPTPIGRAARGAARQVHEGVGSGLKMPGSLWGSSASVISPDRPASASGS
jgi:hypothetical protein